MKSLRWLIVSLAVLPLAVACGGSSDKSGGNTVDDGSGGSSGSKGGDKGTSGTNSNKDASTTTPGSGGTTTQTSTSDASSKPNNDASDKSDAREVCQSDTDCQATHQTRVHCNAANTCVACVTDAHCTSDAGKQACDTATNQCVAACDSDTDCSGRGFGGGGTHCKADTHRCVGCVTSEDCIGDGGSSRKICSTTANRCVECMADTDCTGSHKFCNTQSNSCYDCNADTDCSGATPHCSQNACRECTEDSHCAGKVGDGGEALTRCGSGNICKPPRAEAGPETPKDGSAQETSVAADAKASD